MNITFELLSGSAAFAIICTIVFFVVCVLAFSIESSFAEENRLSMQQRGYAAGATEFSYPKFILGCIVAWLVLYAIGAVFTWWISSSSTPDRDATTYDTLPAYGLEAEATYPLYLGGINTSVSGSAYASGGLFSSSAVIDLKPTNVVNIGFEHKGLWWPLALPADRTPFQVSDENSVTIEFSDSKLSEPLSRETAHWEVTWSECRPLLKNFVLFCERTIEKEELVISDYWLDASIPYFFEEYFAQAQINLTPDQHAILFPKN